jgi:hypothetical protein
MMMSGFIMQGFKMDYTEILLVYLVLLYSCVFHISQSVNLINPFLRSRFKT